MNSKLREKAKSDFKKELFNLMNSAVFEKLWKMRENMEIITF